MSKLRLISRSNGNYINPELMVLKKRDAIRICLDCRQINSRLEDDRELPAGIEEIFQMFWRRMYECHGFNGKFSAKKTRKK